jgi:ribosome biogenesis protein Nip4
MEDMRNVHKVLARKSEGKRPLRRPRHWWGHYIKMVLKEIRFGIVDFIQLAQDRDWWQAVVNTVMCIFNFHNMQDFLD